MRVAYCAIPKPGGLYTFYRVLRDALRAHDIEVACAAVGRDARKWRQDFVYGWCERIAPDETDAARAAEALIDWVDRHRIDVVVPGYSRVAQLAAPYLPDRVAVVQRCWGITRQIYRSVAELRDHAFRIVCESARQQQDLRGTRGVLAEQIALIPNAVPDSNFLPDKAPPTDGRVRLGVVSRLDHTDKGMLYLPGIVRALALAPDRWSLDIIGGGPAEDRLRHSLRRYIEAGQITMHGSLLPQDIPQRLGRIDIVLIPSRREGFGYTLVEAMAARCVPVASRIPGVTDWIVRHGQTGLLCGIGDTKGFARAIEHLAQDPVRLRQMALAAQQEAHRRFAMPQFAEAWAALLRQAAGAQESGGPSCRRPRDRALLTGSPRCAWYTPWPFRRHSH